MILVDLSDAIAGFLPECGPRDAVFEIELKAVIKDQLNGVIDYIDGFEAGDYDEEDLICLTKDSWFSLHNYRDMEIVEDPESLLNAEIFEAMMHALVVNRHPDVFPSREFSLHGNLLRVETREDTQ